MTNAPHGVYHTRIEWIDTDAAGIYHNAAITRFVEAAEATLMRGHGLHDYFARAPRAHYEVDFEAPLRFGQEVTATVEITAVGRSSMTFQFEVWGEADAERPRVRAAHGSYVTVHVGTAHDAQDGAASAPWPADWVAALRAPARW